MKNLLSIVFASVLTLSFFTTVYAAPFKDVNLYKNEVDYLVNKNIIKGYEDGTFNPSAELNRLNAVQMILREKGITDFTAPNPNFTDLKPGSYGYEEVAKAVQLGFISGKTAEDGSKFFDARGTLTRAQMAKILTEAYSLETNNGLSFADVSDKHWAKTYISRLATANITTGYEDKSFKPENKLQRQHFAVFMARQLNPAFKVTPEPPAEPGDDVPINDDGETLKPKPTPVDGQKLMTRAQAEAHVSSYLTKDSYGYSLVSGSGRKSISVTFLTNESGKANLSLDGVNYISGIEIKPEDFGQQNYDEAKAHLAQMNAAIKVYAETQFGVGSKEASTLIAEIKKMTLEGENRDEKKISLQGVTITIAKHGTSTRIFY